MKIGRLEIKLNNKKKDVQKSHSSYIPSYNSGFLSTLINTGTPVYRNLSEARYLLKCYYENPVVNAVLNYLAETEANAEFFVKDLKTDELTPINKYNDDKGALRTLISNPNPLQASKEWIINTSLNENVFGNVYMYGTMPVGYENTFTYEDITSLKNLPTYLVAPKLTGKWLEATEIDEIISYYSLMLNGRETKIPTNQVLHLSNSNLTFDAHFTEGVSKLCALQQPISNIDIAYESRNTLGKNRSALGMITPESTADENLVGQVPIDTNEKEEIQEEFKSQYGLLDNQWNTLIARRSLKYVRMGFNVKELMLFEEVSHSTLAICNSFGLPELLAKNYIAGGTFANLDASEKRLYETTVIPKMQSKMIALNKYLKLEQFGIELVASYDHIEVLQENKKKAAETNKINSATAKDQFFSGLITYGQWAVAANISLEKPSMENLFFKDLTPEDRDILRPSKAVTT